jgi:hypothetical protein
VKQGKGETVTIGLPGASAGGWIALVAAFWTALVEMQLKTLCAFPS